MKIILYTFIVLLNGCSTTYENKNVVNSDLVSFTGTSLSGQKWHLPIDLKQQPAILLLGYKQNTQFDIDRWLIGLDMTETSIPVFEVPAIQGFFPKLFQKSIDDGMRSGIPEELWKIVITVYEDGETLQKFTGNERVLNARVLLIDQGGKIRFFHDRGFSVKALNELKDAIIHLGNKK